MNCREFERALNDRIDARGAAPPGLARAIEGHAAVCPTCRTLGARYQALCQAIRPPETLPCPPSGFVDRVLAASSADRRPVPWRMGLRLAPFVAAAAAVVAAVALGLSLRPAGPKSVEATADQAARARAIDPKDLADALADVRSATWDLAREASAPAARVGRQVLGSPESPRPAPALFSPAGVRPAADVWRSVEDRVNAGVRPLEGSARHAFGFLLGDSPEDDRPPPRPAEGA